MRSAHLILELALTKPLQAGPGGSSGRYIHSCNSFASIMREGDAGTVRLRRGITVARAIEVLGERESEASNTAQRQRQHLLDAYMTWVRNTEIHYNSLFAEDEMLGRLHSPRHWHIRAHGWNEDLRIGLAVVIDELDAQRRYISEAIDALGRLIPLRERDGEMLVLDTNTMLHYRPADEILWDEEFGFKRSRLIVPLVVLDELDQKTYASSKQLAGRAETRLRMLDTHLEKAALGASEIRPGVTIEILADPPNHRRHADVDHEFLDCVELICQSVERAVTVVSGDRGMRVRGLSRGIPVRPLGAKFRLPLGEA